MTRKCAALNNTLIKGLAVLELLGRSARPLGVTELGNELGVAKSNVHRLLQALVELKYVSRDEATGSYKPSIRLWGLGTSVLANFDLRQVAEPVMQRLLEQTRETVHLSVLDGEEITYVHQLESPQAIRAWTQVGSRATAYCVATGKAMLAFQDEAFLTRLSKRLKARTPRTLTEPRAFLREMALTRERGFAMNQGEWREGVNGVAAPVHDPTGHVAAAIGISAPAARLKPAAQRALGAALLGAAMDISLGLAGDGNALRELTIRMRRVARHR